MSDPDRWKHETCGTCDNLGNLTGLCFGWCYWLSDRNATDPACPAWARKEEP